MSFPGLGIRITVDALQIDGIQQVAGGHRVVEESGDVAYSSCFQVLQVEYGELGGSQASTVASALDDIGN